MILLVAAVAQELDWLGPRADVDVLVCGVGPVDAAARVARKLAMHRYDTVIGAGIGGALRGCAEIGDGVVIGEELMEIDLETGGKLALPEGGFIADRIPADAQLIDAITTLGFAQMRGITVARVTATSATAERLRAKGAEVESMEGFAVLRAAQLAGVPAIELRGISNYVGDRDESEWDFGAGLQGLRRIVNATLDLLHTAPANVD